MLHTRCQAAFDAQDDELLIKLITCLCKVTESQTRLGVTERQTVEVVLRGDPGTEVSAP